MGYILGQYHKALNQDNQDGFFMTLWKENLPFVDRKKGRVSPIAQMDDDFEFEDECLRSSVGFLNTESYYFHGKIKKRLEPQRFYVKLTNFEEKINNIEQFITEINVPGGYAEEYGDEDGWFDIEFTFTPTVIFDCLWFQMIRTREDYVDGARYAKIIYEELSLINNLLSKDQFKNMDTGVIKMGIQSRPHFLMFINKEEIRTDRSGIYEVKNGNVLVNTFSIIGRAKHNDSNLLHNTMLEIDSALGHNEKNWQLWKSIYSVSIMGAPKTRTLDAFTMDYMFREKLQ